jgi:hypothetical protein
MINLNEEDWFIYPNKEINMAKGKSAEQIALVVDGEIASFIGIDPNLSNVFLNATSFIECESLESGVFCITVSDGTNTETILCNEMIYAILLSSPTIVKVDISIHAYADRAEPGWLYVDGQFIVPGEYD